MSMQNQNVKPIIFLSVLAEPENSEECTCHSAWSNTLKPSGNCLPVHQGLLVINQVLDPRSSCYEVLQSPATGPGLKVDPRLVGLIIHVDPKGLTVLFWSLRNAYEQNLKLLFLTQYNH